VEFWAFALHTAQASINANRVFMGHLSLVYAELATPSLRISYLCSINQFPVSLFL
jgi:hypothetical protein